MKTIILTPKELKEHGIEKLAYASPLLKPESTLAHKYLDGLKGIEIGPAAYQPFGLDSIAVSTGDPEDRELYKGLELILSGRYVELDHLAEAHDLPFPDDSQDYVLSSHVIEHTPNPIACFLEWNRVVRHGGYIYMIVPKRENPYGDEGRMITPLMYYYQAGMEKWTLEDAFEKTPDKSSLPRNRCHYWVFDLLNLIDLVSACNKFYLMNWKLIEAHETDDKDGEGHMVIYQVNKQGETE